MGKISIVSAKYIINASIEIDGVVDRPDVIGAIFGQTEGLLGTDLELRELQRGGRIGRIEVNLETKGGKTKGTMTIPSSLDKAETSIIAAALEVIERIGPCNAKIKVESIEDVRIAKRKYIIERAKNLLSGLMDKGVSDSQEIAEEVAKSVRTMEIREYGREKLAAGPNIDESDEIIVVEGRADVINMLKYGFKNVIAMNGNSVPQTIIDLSKKKTITVFIDGDRGGQLNLKQLLTLAEIDFVAVAPDGKEVEELTSKEIHKCLRGKITAEQFSLEHNIDTNKEEKESNEEEMKKQNTQYNNNNHNNNNNNQKDNRDNKDKNKVRKPIINARREKNDEKELSADDKKILKERIDDLLGSKAAYILDRNLAILGKLPISELTSTLKDIKDEIYAVVIDGAIDKELSEALDKASVKMVVAMNKDNSIKNRRGIMISYDELEA
ncbi:MAG: primase [Candidatus Woesearchaeota archaeon]|nr:primase [Candidatus Woesearchaeota archaeon]